MVCCQTEVFFVDVPINSKTHLVLIFIGAIRPLKITMTVLVHPQVHEYRFSIFLFIYLSFFYLSLYLTILFIYLSTLFSSSSWRRIALSLLRILGSILKNLMVISTSRVQVTPASRPSLDTAARYNTYR